MEYKGFIGTYEYDCENYLFYGSIIADKIISYEGRTLKEIEIDFKRAVDEYLKNKGE